MIVRKRKEIERGNLVGQRITYQRALLLDLLKESAGHLDADELYDRARQRVPRLSLSTVYRNLQLFKKLGLVDEHHLGEEHHHYEARGTAEHCHLVCLGCGKVVELLCPVTEQMREDIGKEHDFEIARTELHLEGYCRMCRETKRPD